MNPYRCETCNHKDKYGFCEILHYRVISPECITVQQNFTERVGCASHSDFQSERVKVLVELENIMRKEEINNDRTGYESFVWILHEIIPKLKQEKEK